MARQSAVESLLEEAWKMVGLEAKGPLAGMEEKDTSREHASVHLPKTNA